MSEENLENKVSCYDCEGVTKLQSDMGSHGKIYYCEKCSISTYKKFVEKVSLNYQLMNYAPKRD